jgi:hypothetical protein
MIPPDPPRLTTFLAQLETLFVPHLAYPYLYPDLAMVKLFLYATIRRLTGFKTLHSHLAERPDILALVGLECLPHRTTLANRFRQLPDRARDLLHQLTEQFLRDGLVDESVASADSTLMHANGNVWHAKQLNEGVLPECGNIDIEAHWGMSGCKQWVFGYRLHDLVLCGPDGFTWPCEVSVHPANVKDAAVFRTELVPSLPHGTRLALGDSGYDDASCVEVCEVCEVTLLTPVKRVGKNTGAERLERAELSRSPEGREALSLRKTSVEPFQGQLKELFGLEYLPMKGLKNVRALCGLAVLAYALLVRLNILLERPPRQIKNTMHNLL